MLSFVLLACQNVSLCINRRNGDLCVSRHFSKPTQKRRSQKCRLRRSLLYIWKKVTTNVTILYHKCKKRLRHICEKGIPPNAKKHVFPYILQLRSYFFYLGILTCISVAFLLQESLNWQKNVSAPWTLVLPHDESIRHYHVGVSVQVGPGSSGIVWSDCIYRLTAGKTHVNMLAS